MSDERSNTEAIVARIESNMEANREVSTRAIIAYARGCLEYEQMKGKTDFLRWMKLRWSTPPKTAMTELAIANLADEWQIDDFCGDPGSLAVLAGYGPKHEVVEEVIRKSTDGEYMSVSRIRTMMKKHKDDHGAKKRKKDVAVDDEPAEDKSVDIFLKVMFGKAPRIREKMKAGMVFGEDVDRQVRAGLADMEEIMAMVKEVVAA
jgi:hypothetical protein